MRFFKRNLAKIYFTVLATALALAPTLMVLADGAGNSE